MSAPDLKLVEPTYSVIAFFGRALPKSYEAMIFAKWLRSLRYGNPLFKKIDSDMYYKHYHPFIAHLLKMPETIVRMAALSDDHDVVLGFSVTRGHILDYVHVNREYRRMGIARKLVPSDTKEISHVTLTALQILEPKLKSKEIKFNPFLGEKK